MPKLSIIVTTYNVEAYLQQCLDGIVAQTLGDIEIIIVDDGSTDGTPQIIRDFAARDDRIRPILFETNTIGGVASAANAGLEVASGDYIGFADGDDIYDPQMFEVLYNAAMDHDADLAMCRYHVLDVGTGRLRDPAEVNQWIAFPETTALDLDVAARRQILRFIAVPWRKIYRRDMVERANLRFPVVDFFYEDNPFHWAAVLAATKVVVVPERLCQHRQGREGQTMTSVDTNVLKLFEHHDTIRKLLKEKGVEDDYASELLRWVAMQLSWISWQIGADVQQPLYDLLVPILAQYSDEQIEEFGETHGHTRTTKMLEALKAKDFSEFSKAASESEGPGGSLLYRASFHLRNYGLRHTMDLAKRYLAERAAQLRGPNASGRSSSGQALSTKDLMTGYVVLQRELRSLRAEVRDLRERLEKQEKHD